MIKMNFKTYDEFASADLDEIYGSDMLNNSLHYRANIFAHLWFENKGDGHYKTHVLPNQAQFSTVNSIVFFDYDKDNYLDVLIAGNLYDTEVETPRSDAGIGLVLQNQKGNGFNSIPMSESGLLVDTEIKTIAPIKIGTKKVQGYLFAANNDSLRIFEYNSQLYK